MGGYAIAMTIFYLLGALAFVLGIWAPSVGLALPLVAVFIHLERLPVLYTVHSADLRLTDAWLIAFVLGLGIRLLLKRVQLSFWVFRLLWPLALLLVWIGLSVVGVYVRFPYLVVRSLVAYIRLLVTSLYLVGAYLSIRNSRDAWIVSGWLVLGSTVVLWVMLRQWASNVIRGSHTIHYLIWVSSSWRYGSIVSYNTVGLLASLLAVVSFIMLFAIRSKWRWLAILFLIASLLSLWLVKSRASALGLVVSLSLYLLYRFRDHLKYALVGIVVLLGGFLLLWNTRSPVLQGDLGLGNRGLYFADALKVFLHYPLIGAGWEVNGRAIAGDVTKVASGYVYIAPHNSYVQILAELGVIGFILLILSGWQIGRYVVAALRACKSESLKAALTIWSFVVVTILVWLNGNAIYGGNAEIILLFTSLGVIVSLVEQVLHPEVITSVESLSV